jgi:biopolymer transport protein ExbB/TolQ
MTALYGALAVIVVSLISGYVTWLVARRTTSGKIDTSEAAKLWDEGTAMRLELRDEVAALKTQLHEAVVAVTGLNREIQASRAETEASREETRLSRAETRRLMSQIEELHGEVRTHNQLTIGQLADNTETRRIQEIPKEDRTAFEDAHLAGADERLPEGKRPDIAAEDKEL